MRQDRFVVTQTVSDILDKFGVTKVSDLAKIYKQQRGTRWLERTHGMGWKKICEIQNAILVYLLGEIDLNQEKSSENARQCRY